MCVKYSRREGGEELAEKLFKGDDLHDYIKKAIFIENYGD